MKNCLRPKRNTSPAHLPRQVNDGFRPRKPRRLDHPPLSTILHRNDGVNFDIHKADTSKWKGENKSRVTKLYRGQKLLIIRLEVKKLPRRQRETCRFASGIAAIAPLMAGTIRFLDCIIPYKYNASSTQPKSMRQRLPAKSSPHGNLEMHLVTSTLHRKLEDSVPRHSTHQSALPLQARQ